MNIFITPGETGTPGSSKVINARRKAIAWMMLDEQLKEKWLTVKKKSQPVRKKAAAVRTNRLAIMPAEERVNRVNTAA